MGTVRILSGIGVKGPACIQLNMRERRWILDCGEGPDEGAAFDPAWLEGADAVFVTHDHEDHVAGAQHAVAAGLPIYATALTAKSLPAGAKLRLLPESGVVDIDGVELRLGRNGHALGGVWMHFAIGGGLFYSGDWSEESDWFAFEAPPRAETAILDCSYHHDGVTQKDRIAALDDLLDRLPGQVLLPVPPSGRAGELALRLMQRFGAAQVALDQACRDVLRIALQSRGVTPAAAAVSPLLEKELTAEVRFLICDTPNAEAGQARTILDQWRSQGRLGRDAHIVFTGHTNAFAKTLCSAPGGYFQRWNVHPPLGDQCKMLARLGARRFVPAFCSNPDAYLDLPDLAASVALTEEIWL